jgi:exosome complex component RRP42
MWVQTEGILELWSLKSGDYLLTVVFFFIVKVGKHYFVDATAEEESQMRSAVSVAVNRKGVICGVTKRGGDGLDPSVIIDMISVAQQVALTYIPALDLQIAAAESVDPDS